MATLFEVLQFTDNSGNPLSGGLVYWENAGLTTPKTVWKDAAEVASHTYPIVLDIGGRPPGGSIFMRGSYKLRVKDSTDSIAYVTIDNINEYNQYDFTGLTASIADLNSTKTTALSINSTFTVTSTHRGNTLLCDATSASFNINLLPSVTALNTYEITIKKVDVSANAITVLPNASEKIDTDIDIILYDFNDFVKLHNDGSNWKVIASQIRGTVVTLAATAPMLTLEDNGKMFNCNCASANISILLPDCRNVGRGYKIIAKKIDSSSTNSATVVALSPQTIDGAINFVLNVQNQSVEMKTDGLNWFIINQSGESSTIFSTGFVMPSYNPSIAGWVLMNDGTIGDATSGATTRANADTSNLFTVLWDNLFTKVIRSGGAIVPPGVSAAADFAAHRTIDLPKALGRVLCSVGGATPDLLFHNGESYGNYFNAFSVSNLPNHYHTYVNAAGSGSKVFSISSDSPTVNYSEATNQTGMISTPFGIVQCLTALNYLIKL